MTTRCRQYLEQNQRPTTGVRIPFCKKLRERAISLNDLSAVVRALNSLNSLSIQSLGFNGLSAGRHLGSAPDENGTLIERFRCVDADTLIYKFTITDPTVWTKPWSVSLPMTKSRERLYEYACHEGNYGMRNILSGARAAENAAQAGTTGSEGSRR
jgi:hypothetical protein